MKRERAEWTGQIIGLKSGHRHASSSRSLDGRERSRVQLCRWLWMMHADVNAHGDEWVLLMNRKSLVKSPSRIYWNRPFRHRSTWIISWRRGFLGFLAYECVWSVWHAQENIGSSKPRTFQRPVTNMKMIPLQNSKMQFKCVKWDQARKRDQPTSATHPMPLPCWKMKLFNMKTAKVSFDFIRAFSN